MVVLMSLVITFFISTITVSIWFVAVIRNLTDRDIKVDFWEIVMLFIGFLTIYVANIITLELVLALWGKI